MYAPTRVTRVYTKNKKKNSQSVIEKQFAILCMMDSQTLPPKYNISKTRLSVIYQIGKYFSIIAIFQDFCV